MQLTEAVRFFSVSLCGHKDQGFLVGAGSQVPIDSVVTQIGFSTGKPFGKRWIGVIANLFEWLMPINQFGLFTPEAIAVIDRTAEKIGITAHGVSIHTV
jgi:hypothetical protein